MKIQYCSFLHSDIKFCFYFQVDSVKSSLYDTDNQSSEMEDLKRQLNVALCEVSNAEQELLRLRQRKSDVIALEQQVTTDVTVRTIFRNYRTCAATYCQHNMNTY
jgi:hypothetical protein